MLTSMLAATAFLTRVPISRRFSADDVTRSMPLFPLVGALVGIGQWGLLYVLRRALAPLLAAVLVVAGAIWATRALHLDGLADMADGLGGGRTREDSLRIMRDSAIGTFGAAALMLVLLVRIVAISTLVERRSADAFIVLAPTLGRWSMQAMAATITYARAEGGLGAMAGRLTRAQALLGTGIAAALSVGVAGRHAAPGWFAALVVTAALASICVRRLGGFTGDTLGACNELTEAAVLLVGVVITR